MGDEPSTVEPDANACGKPSGNDECLDFRKIVARHHEAVYRYAYRLAGNQADAEDLTQQAFLVAQQRLSQVREAAKIRAWLFTVLRNCYLKSCRKVRPVPTTSLDLDLEQVAEAPSREEIDEAALQLALEDLPEDFRIVVLMFYFEDCSYKEIAAQLEIPIGTVMSRLARAKAHLRRRLISGQEASMAEGRRPAAPCGQRQKTSGELTHDPVGQ